MRSKCINVKDIKELLPHSCCSVAQLGLTLFVTPWTAERQASLSHCLPEFAQTHVHWVDDVIQPPYPLSPLLLLPSIFPSIRVSSNESTLCIRWPRTGASASAPVHIKNIQGWLLLWLTGWISLLSKELSSLLQNHSSKTSTLQHSTLRSNSHIRTWLLEKLYLWLYGPLSAKWCLCFVSHCLGLL